MADQLPTWAPWVIGGGCITCNNSNSVVYDEKG